MELARMDVGRDADTYAVGIDEHGQPIEGDVSAYLAVVAPMPEPEAVEWAECVGACLDNAPELPAATDDDYAAWLA